nr:MAG TPA: hypothetical protein [Bacteriophage sp.]
MDIIVLRVKPTLMFFTDLMAPMQGALFEI